MRSLSLKEKEREKKEEKKAQTTNYTRRNPYLALPTLSSNTEARISGIAWSHQWNPSKFKVMFERMSAGVFPAWKYGKHISECI